MLAVQLLAYTVGVIGIYERRIGQLRLVSAVSSLIVLNSAALMSWFVYFSGRSGRSWTKVAYNKPATVVAGSAT
jgi:hypothetical protein